MNKYLMIAKNTWNEILTYRLNFVIWRIRVVLQLLTIYFIWHSVLPKDATLQSYNQSQILTYILGTSIIGSLVLASRSYSVGDEIDKGDLSNFLIKPINYFFYHFARDIADKAMNLTLATIELSIIFTLLKPPLFVQTQLDYLVFTILAVVLALIMYFFINFLIGLIGFWSSETWGPRFLFFMVIGFVSGGLFPLDLLPQSVFSMMKLLPFTYLFYFPLKIYLGQLSAGEIFFGLSITIFWISALFLIVKLVWLKGLKIYTAQGR